MIGELSSAEMNERHKASLLKAPMKVSCALCCWKARGLAGHVLELQKAHRKQAHGIKEFKLNRRGISNLHRFKQAPLSDEENREHEVERLKRMRLIGGFGEEAA